MNIFVEGLQGSGKSTMVRRIHEAMPDCTPVMEGDYSPVELAWCACMDEAACRAILEKYPDLRPQIRAKTVAEGDRRIICYTQVRTDNRDFYADLERYEIYNGRRSFDEFRSILLERYRRWHGNGMIFECSLLQNTVEDMILFRQASDGEILRFYAEVREALAGKEYRVLYLETEDIGASIDAVRRERVDERGEERWFSLVCEYFDASPWARANGVTGFEGFVAHLRHRQALELRILREIFPEKAILLKSKKVDAFDPAWIG